MISRYRNHAIVRITTAFVTLFVAFVVMALTDSTPQKHLGQFIATILALGGFIAYVFGCTAWAKAKGYSSSVAIGLIAVGAFCICLFTFILPPVVLFALDDKTAAYRHHSRRSRWSKWFK